MPILELHPVSLRCYFKATLEWFIYFLHWLTGEVRGLKARGGYEMGKGEIDFREAHF
ncbi:MAG: hypothetical protein JEZ14_12755 [Marinilabiliaceae bacterium]|nr:hypothetical protein [Marinilabiliaceae bacterium]